MEECLSPTPFGFHSLYFSYREKEGREKREKKIEGEREKVRERFDFERKMEKHKCKLCFRSFSNGRALGGHMRSHMLNLPIPPKQEQPSQIGDDETESASSSSSSEEEGEDKGLGYELRENPKKSIRLADPEFSFAVDAASVVLQDRESETESSKNPTRRRSKRNRKLGLADPPRFHEQKKIKLDKLSKTESWADPEPVSSISDATTEEDVAFCLMMLSRDKWIEEQENQERRHDEEDEEEAEAEAEEEERFVDETDDSDELKLFKTRARGKYKCETCNKVFRSYQALGGHRASHKKIKACAPIKEVEFEPENASNPCLADAKIHECPVCFRKFTSGQALGGHKRSHISGSAAAAAAPAPPPPPRKASSKVGDSMIDLNLPAPIEDDDISQIEHSAVSDAEFVNPIRR